MSTYFIPSHVHVCMTGRNTILLDLRNDRYLGLGTTESQAVSSLVEGWPVATVVSCASDLPSASSDGSSPQSTPDDCFDRQTVESLVANLLDRKLITADRTAGRNTAPPTVETAACTTEHDGSMRFRYRDIVNFVAACSTVAFLQRFRTLEYIANRAAARKSRSATQQMLDEHRVAELATTFLNLRPFLFTARQACLFDSLALVEFLARYRIHATWIVGVQSGPFEAHSWVQYRSMVLNDIPGTVLHYTPILAI